MMRRLRLDGWVVVAIAASAACGSKVMLLDSTDDGQMAVDTGDDEGMNTLPGMTTLPPSTTGAVTTADDTVGVDEGGTTSIDEGTTDEGTSDGGTSDGGSMCPPNPNAGINGSTCAADCDCVSEHCFVIPVLGGLCGACTIDAHCPGGGCTPPNPIAGVGSTCSMGEPGGGCETDAACQAGLVCAEVLAVPGIITVSTCGDCQTDADCGGGMLCSPDLDVANFVGQLRCVQPGSQANGQTCDHEGSGNQACNSGICAVVDVMGVLQLGVCSECSANNQCGPGQSCAPADFDIDTSTITPATCTP